jgi:hypothetical protein
VKRAPSVTVSNDTVQTNLVEVGSLELQHLKDTGAVYFIRCLPYLRVDIVTAETRGDQLLTVLVEKLESWPMATSGDLDQLCKAVSDLCFGESLEEREVEECVHGSVVSSKSVLVVAVVNGDLDTDTSIDQANDSGRNANVVGGPPVSCTSKSRVFS